MRKFFLLLILVSLLLIPTLAQAQSNISLKELGIQLWPEYDRTEMLVMYSFLLTDDTPLPANLEIRIPVDANLNAVAKLSQGEMLTVPYDLPIVDGDWKVLTLVMDEITTYRVEYYEPMDIEEDARHFSLLWESDYDTGLVFVELQEPPSAKNLVTKPILPNSQPVQEGMIYHTLKSGQLPAGEPFAIEVSYDKDNDDLTVSSMPVVVGGLSENASSDFSLSDSLPTILVGVGILLIIGGILYFFLAGRGEKTSSTSRKRHKASGGTKYCHECGSRSSGNDKFC
ncbi:MAG: hypothetical protein HN922_06990, partial [Anaerolineae bacterium]|nr:hypothetical protein [Anaerolineae bacterium]